ncbi:MAG: RsmF rRNA methyltransferase first C-terminal domain-containing protein [bacterium]|nr:RsmF rRNA methyltransferase first C-terminal domain-containing protein [bacterium]
MEEQSVKERLPKAFLDRMKDALQGEFEEFLASYESPRAYGLRYNPLKTDAKSFEEMMPGLLGRVPWAAEGYYYDCAMRPGKHPMHEAGLYYIQEPSAMCVVEVLDPKPGEVILDLCAAPGGKSTQIAGRMGGKGLLVCNEPVANRAKILSQNMERMGVRNAVVTNAFPWDLENCYPCFFDRIVVDAPCSGEGMFHKEEAALTEWSQENVTLCSNRQRQILESAWKMLKPGGTMVYSTCTFAPAEDEEMVIWMLDTYADAVLSAIDTRMLGISDGSVEGTGRIWPHKQQGEGHFVARFRKKGESVEVPDVWTSPPKKKEKRGEEWKEFEEFAKDTLTVELSGKRTVFGDQLYLMPMEQPDIKGQKVLRPGLHLGTRKKNRFEPSHALALALRAEEVTVSFETTEPERFLRGETLNCPPELKGWVLITSEGVSLGWGKASSGVIKNHYPKGLRINW